MLILLAEYHQVVGTTSRVPTPRTTLRTTTSLHPSRWPLSATFPHRYDRKLLRQRPFKASRTLTIGTWRKYWRTSPIPLSETSFLITHSQCLLLGKMRIMLGHHLNLQASYSIRKIAVHQVVTVLINLPTVCSPLTPRKIVNKNLTLVGSTTFGRYQGSKVKQVRRPRHSHKLLHRSNSNSSRLGNPLHLRQSLRSFRSQISIRKTLTTRRQTWTCYPTRSSARIKRLWTQATTRTSWARLMQASSTIRVKTSRPCGQRLR